MGKNSQLRLTQYDSNAFNKNIKCPFNRPDKTFISNNKWGYNGKIYRKMLCGLCLNINVYNICEMHTKKYI
jgi:hypothetical protein